MYKVEYRSMPHITSQNCSAVFCRKNGKYDLTDLSPSVYCEHFLFYLKEELGLLILPLLPPMAGLNSQKHTPKNKRVFTPSFRCYIMDEESIERTLPIDEVITRLCGHHGGILMARRDDALIIEEIGIETEEYTDDSLFNITSYGVDLSFREIISMYKEGDLEKPEMQRNYVWSKVEASRFIDSILLGLPIPSIFLAKTQSEKRLIVDGYQRIMTVYDYVERGLFGGDNKLFKLSNVESINERWRGKAFKELSTEEQRKIRGSSIHAIVFEQKHPQNDTGMYQIFERINTSGRALKPQEIRNCVYHGSFNLLLLKLNKEPAWRFLLNAENEDARMGDVELILRSFAIGLLRHDKRLDKKRINLAKYLNEFMGENSNILGESSEMATLFVTAVNYIKDHIGANAFKGISEKSKNYTKKINPAIMDSILGATYYMIETKQQLPADSLADKHVELVSNEDFRIAISVKTTEVEESIKRRTALATQMLFGVEYDWR